MPHEYTRQRQGRDFSPKYPRDGGDNAGSLHDLIEQFRKESERNAVPVDGQEPPKEREGDANER